MVQQRFDGIRRASRVGLYIGGFSAAILLVVGFVLLFGATGTNVGPIVGIAVAAVAVLLVVLLICLWSMIDVFVKIEANTYRMYDVLRDIQAVEQENREQYRLVADSVQLSDTVKAITHRDKERTALRLAINEEIVRGDWEAAYSLVELLESRHGYRSEAARLRQEVDQSRELLRNTEVQEVVEQVKTLIDASDWDRARREMDRLLTDQPAVAEVQALPGLFAKRRGEHKRRLLKLWDESVQRNEVDRGIAILKELDQYLTPNEAAALQESARGVFRAKLHNLGVQFSLAVADHSWKEALAVSRQIMEEFPNSRMAQEVRERLEVLTQRAEEMDREKDSGVEATRTEVN